MIRFAVLGPLTVSRDDTPMTLSAQLQRRLLAVLLASGGRPVPLPSIVDSLWGAAPPATAKKTLQVYVHRLRKMLESGDGPQRISHGATGYVLSVYPGELDADEFATLVGKGRELAQAGQLEAASETLQRALALWRGPAYSDVRDDAFVAECARKLDDERLWCHEERLHLDLALGRFSVVIPELQALVAGHPYRENLREQLMLAFYRVGRRAEALQVYRDARRQLSEELGLEPGPALQEAHEAMLRDEIASASGPAPASAGQPRPHQLPLVTGGFTAREESLRWLDSQLAEHPQRTSVAIISGMGGVGKTTLAVHWARRVAGYFPDGVLYVNLRGYDPAGNAVSPHDAIRGFLPMLGVQPPVPADPDALVNLLRSALATKQVLMVLDNARDANQVRPLLPGSAGSMVLVTSRARLPSLTAIEGARSLNLAPISAAESRALLTERLGAQRVIAEPTAIDKIITICGGLPLALAVAAAQAEQTPTLSDLVETLHHPLDGLSSDDPVADLRAVFASSHQTLDEPSARLFRLLGLHPGPDFSRYAAASLAGIPTGQAQLLLTRLERASLVTQSAPGRYVFHDLMREYAHELATTTHTNEQNTAAMQGLLDHYLLMLGRSETLLDPHRDPIGPTAQPEPHPPEALSDHDDALAWYMTERTTVLALIRQAYHLGFDIHCWQMTWMAANFFERQGHWHEIAQLAQLAVQAAQRFGDRSAEARCRRTLSRMCAHIGDNATAFANLELALELYETLEDRVGAAWVRLNLNIVCGDESRWEEALTHGRAALALFRETGNPIGEGQSLNAIAWAEAHLGRHGPALIHCRAAIGLQQQHGDRSAEADTWDTMGYIRLHRKEFRAAAESYRQALQLFYALGDRYNQARSLIQLGEALVATGDRQGAHDAWQRALQLLVQLRHQDAVKVRAKLARLRSPSALPSG